MVRKYLKYHRGYLLGSMDESTADELIEIRQLESIPALKNVVVDLTKNQINAIVNHYEPYLRKKKTLAGVGEPKLSEIKQGTLEDYQTVGAAYMFTAKAVLLGDEVGLGKTVQSAAVIKLLSVQAKRQGRKSRYVFVTELAAAPEIREKLVRFTGEYIYLLPNANKSEIDRLYSYDETFNDISIVTSHSAMANQQFLAYLLQGGFEAIFFDEGSPLRKTTNEIYKNTSQFFKTVEYKYILNATPIEIHLKDMYTQMNILDFHYLPYYGDFEKEYVRKRRQGYGFVTVGYKNEEQFFKFIQLRYLARTREQLNAKYVNNEYKMIVVPLSEEQKNIINSTSLKSQVVDCPSSVYSSIPFNAETTPKVKALIHLLEAEAIAGKKKCIIYCRYKEAQVGLLDEIELMGLRVESINGYVKKRSEITDRLANDELDVIVTSVYKALDIGCADVAILYSIDDNPQIMRQFEGRITRSFDVEGKSVYLLVSEGYELQKVETRLNLRITASQTLAVSGHSMLFSAVTQDVAREDFVSIQEELPLGD